MTNIAGLIERLLAHEVEFVLIGGVAANLHGSARLTLDVDVVYRRSAENLRRIAEALGPLKPYLRGAPAGLPFQWDVETLKRALNLTLETSLGSIDLLGEVAGGGTWESLAPGSREIELGGRECRVVSLEQLIALKRAAGRPKDLESIAELELIRDDSRA